LLLTRSGLAVLTLASFLLITALATGNLVVLTLALLPLSFLILGAAATQARRIHAELKLPDRAVRLGENLLVTVEYEVRGGRGIIELHQPVPGPFLLVSGSNVQVVSKRPGVLRGNYIFTVRATRRGEHIFPPLDWEHMGALGLTGSRKGTAGLGAAMHVRPALRVVRRIPRTSSKGPLMGAEAETSPAGIAGTEFREIRQYQHGDAPKTINWKATARADRRRRHVPTAAQRNGPPYAPPDHLVPLVNEYEREGQQHAWIYLDCGPHMRLGTTAENAFEAGVGAAIAVAQYLLARGHRVGFTLYNRKEPLHLYPDVGKRQLFVIQSALAHAEPTDTMGGLAAAVLETKRFLVGTRHRIVVISRAEADHPALPDGLRLLRRIAGGRRRRAGILLIGIDPYGLIPEAHAGTIAARLIVRSRQRARHQAIARTGATHLEWDPSTTRIEEILHTRRIVS
jgi:uncharacterized protein (DUF58 family)